MSLFGSAKKPLRDERAPGLPPEDVATLRSMELCIKAAQTNEKAIRDCAARLLAGDRKWTAPIAHWSHSEGRAIEHAAIAEAFKTLKGEQ